jgi:hypothetical protein
MTAVYAAFIRILAGSGFMPLAIAFYSDTRRDNFKNAEILG